MDYDLTSINTLEAAPFKNFLGSGGRITSLRGMWVRSGIASGLGENDIFPDGFAWTSVYEND